MKQSYYNLWENTWKEWDPDKGGTFIAVHSISNASSRPQHDLQKIVAELAWEVSRDPSWMNAKIYKVPCIFSRHDSWIEQTYELPLDLVEEAKSMSWEWQKEVFERSHGLVGFWR